MLKSQFGNTDKFQLFAQNRSILGVLRSSCANALTMGMQASLRQIYIDNLVLQLYQGGPKQDVSAYCLTVKPFCEVWCKATLENWIPGGCEAHCTLDLNTRIGLMYPNDFTVLC